VSSGSTREQVCNFNAGGRVVAAYPIVWKNPGTLCTRFAISLSLITNSQPSPLSLILYPYTFSHSHFSTPFFGCISHVTQHRALAGLTVSTLDFLSRISYPSPVRSKLSRCCLTLAKAISWLGIGGTCPKLKAVMVGR